MTRHRLHLFNKNKWCYDVSRLCIRDRQWHRSKPFLQLIYSFWEIKSFLFSLRSSVCKSSQNIHFILMSVDQTQLSRKDALHLFQIKICCADGVVQRSFYFLRLFNFHFLSRQLFVFLLNLMKNAKAVINPDLEFNSNFLAQRDCEIPQCDWDLKMHSAYQLFLA